MLYKPGKPHANQTNSGPVNKASPQLPTSSAEQKQQHQRNHVWYRLGQFLSSISLFGSHSHLEKSATEGTGNQAQEDLLQQQQSKQPEQKNQSNPNKKKNREISHRQHGRPTAAVSCQNLARGFTDHDKCVVDLTFSDDEDSQHGVNRVAKWATGLSHLLGDPDGISVFAEFLRSEFSEENIKFWRSVEAFKRLSDPIELLAAARRISSVHIDCDAPASVNLDGATVRDLQGRLRHGQQPPDPGMFDSAQEHIFNLMRLDSYSRFLKSPLYKDCLLCELESRPLPTPSAEPSMRNSEISLMSSQQQQQQVEHNGRKLSRDMFASAKLLDPAGQIWQQQQQLQLRRRSRQPSCIVAALDLDHGFSDC